MKKTLIKNLRRIQYFLLSLLLFLITQQSFAQSHLVTHRYIQQKVTENYFRQKPGTTIPVDDYCINASEAASWLYIDESRLPADGRMPWWSEIIPATIYQECPNYSYEACAQANAVYGSCGSWLYDLNFRVDLTSYTRREIAPGSLSNLWKGNPEDKLENCNFTPSSTPASFARTFSQSGGNADSTMSAKGEGMNILSALGSPINRCGIWACNTIPFNQWISASGTVAASSTKIYYIGAAADNDFRIYVDNVLKADYSGEDGEAFKIWHVFPVELTAGLHDIRIEAIDYSGTAIMGCEVYDNTELELDNATNYEDLHILFSTQGLSTICTDQPPPPTEQSVQVLNYSSNNAITAVDGLTGFGLPYYIYGGATYGGTYTGSYGYLSVSVEGWMIAYLTVYADDQVIGEATIDGSNTVSFELLNYPNAVISIVLSNE